MKNRSVAGLIIFTILTLGIYGIYWLVSTKGELNERGAKIPSALLIIVPLVNIYWYWKYYEGAEQVTTGKVNAVLMFVLGFFVTPLIPYALCQSAYNSLGEAQDLTQETNPPAEAVA